MELEVPYNLSENFYHGDGKVKKFFGKIGNVFMQGTFAPTRAAFLAIVRFNPLGIASRFAAGFINDPDFKPEVVAKATPRWEKFKVTWRKLGGAVSRLEKQVKLGYKKRPIQRVEDAIKKLLAQKSSFDGGYNNLTGGEEALIIKSAITALPAIILAIKNQKGIGNPFKQGMGPQDIDIEPTVDAEDVIKTDPTIANIVQNQVMELQKLYKAGTATTPERMILKFQNASEQSPIALDSNEIGLLIGNAVQEGKTRQQIEDAWFSKKTIVSNFKDATKDFDLILNSSFGPEAPGFFESLFDFTTPFANVQEDIKGLFGKIFGK